MSNVGSLFGQKAYSLSPCRLVISPTEASLPRVQPLPQNFKPCPLPSDSRRTTLPSFRASLSRQHLTLAADSGERAAMEPSAVAPPAPTPAAPKDSPFVGLLDPRVSLAVHVGTVVLVGSTFFNRSLFGYHPTLMALSFLLLMPQAILAAIRGTGKARKDAIFQHMVLNAASGVAGAAGLYAIWLNKERNSKPHLVSLHAILGALAFVASSLIATGGIPLIYGFPQALRKAGVPKAVSSAHKKVGMVAFLLGGVVSVLGLQTFKPAHPLHKGPVTYALAALVVLSSALVLLPALKKLNKTKAK